MTASIYCICCGKEATAKEQSIMKKQVASRSSIGERIPASCIYCGNKTFSINPAKATYTGNELIHIFPEGAQ